MIKTYLNLLDIIVLSHRISVCFYALLFILLAVSNVWASSSKLMLQQRAQLLQKQNAELRQLLDKSESQTDETEAELKQRQMLLQLQRERYALALNMATSERQFFLGRQQQATKRLSGVTSQTPYQDLQHTITYNSEMSQYAFVEMQWIEKNDALVLQLIQKNDAKLRQFQLQALKEQRKAEAQKLKDRIKVLRKLNQQALMTGMEMADQPLADERALLANEARRSIANFDNLLRRLEIEKLQLTIKLNYSDYLRIQSGSLMTIERLILRIKELEMRTHEGLKSLAEIATTQQKLLNTWQQQGIDRAELQLFSKQIERQKIESNSLIKGFNALLILVEQHLAEYEQEKAGLILQRKGLLQDTLTQGRQVFTEFMKLPKATGAYLYGLYERVNEFVRGLLPWQQGLLFLGLLAMFGVWFKGKKQQSNYFEKEKALVGEHHVYSVFGHIISRNWGALCLLGGICSLFTIAHIQPISYRLILVIFSVWFVLRAIISITRIALLESLSDVQGMDVRLFHRLRLTFIIGGLITLATVLSHYLHMNYLVLELFDRLFMIFLFTVSLVLLKGHQVILTLIHNHIKPKKFYTKRALDLFTLLAPIALFVNGLLGVLGYVPFAWEMSYYQAIIVLTMVSYVVARGILLDVMEKFSEFLIRRLENGWVWTEAFLKPLHKILLFGLMFLLIATVFQLFGWDADSDVVKLLETIWHYKILELSRVSISVNSIANFCLMVLFLIWLARWSQEFCYRWLYRQVVDQGLRNSLSVFTQYAFIVVGAIFSLTVLGIDISGISMILGGLAVGIGFGLRDFANNIVGGIVLLMERPVKQGDLVSFGEIEGRVTHIGLRSMQIKSWDNYEVVMPNADLFIKPFTNWTYKDSIVRTVVAIKVNRHDSPIKVQQLLLDVLHIIPEVLNEPPSQVLLKGIDGALVELEVRYYIDVNVYTRVEVRSNVLFAIIAQFKAAGIKAPIPPIQIEPSPNENR